jgi:hypothetical protein
MCNVRTASVLIAALAVGLVPLAGHAATVSVDVRGADGKPLAGAVVIVDTPHRPAGPIRFPWPYVMAQEKINFQPHVLIVPVGASVSFPNRDPVRHHVYSFSAPKKFELKLYGRDETRSVVFDKPGLIALGCNIHDSMSGFIWVVDTPFVAQSDAGGHVTIANVPPGGATLRLWHPSIRAPGNVVTQTVTIAPGGYSGTVTAKGK